MKIQNKTCINMNSKEKALLVGECFLLCVHSFVTMMLLSECFRKLVDNILAKTPEVRSMLIRFLCASMLAVIILTVSKIYSFYLKKRIKNRLEDEAVRHICNLKTWQGQFTPMEMIPKLRKDIPDMVDKYEKIIIDGVIIGMGIILGSIYALQVNYKIYLVCLVLMIIILLATYNSFPKLKIYEGEIGKLFNKNYANVNEILQNKEILPLLNGKKMTRGFRQIAEKNVEYNKRKGRVFANVFICKKMSSIILILIICFLGGMMYQSSQETGVRLSDIIILVYLVPNICNKLLAILDWKTMYNGWDAVCERVESIYQLEVNDENGQKSIQKITDVTVKELDFSYDGQLVLDKVNYKVEQGDILYLNGRSGEGKSTLLRLLTKLLVAPSQSIFINGEDIVNIMRSEYWKCISYMPQDLYVFEGTILENITLKCDEVDQERLHRAMEISGLQESMSNFPEHLATLVSETTVSSGERQKICLARVIYKKASLIILDEPTSAMDVASQNRVLCRMKEYVNDNQLLCIWVNHLEESIESL